MTIARLDSEKHSAVCRNCDDGYRPVDPAHWTGPRPCPLCQYSSKEEDSALLERYKVRPGLCLSEVCRLSMDYFQSIFLRLTVKSDVDFDTMCENTVEEMDEVYSNR